MAFDDMPVVIVAGWGQRISGDSIGRAVRNTKCFFKEFTMRLKPSLIVGLWAFASMIAVNANAASHMPAESTTEKAETKKSVQPHSHMEEKTGVKSSSKKSVPAESTRNKTDPAKDKTKHFHPRDK